MIMPSDIYINQQRLDDPQYLGRYIKSLSSGMYGLYPYVVNFHNYSEYHQTYGNNYGSVRSAGFRDSTVLPLFQDDISALIHGLRADYWKNRGSGGPCMWLPNKIIGTTKYSGEHNSRKRRKIEEKRAEVAAREEELARQAQERLRKQQEEAKLEAERLERLRLLREEEDRVQELHRKKRQNDTESRRVYKLVTQYIDKLQASLGAPRAREDQVESLRVRLEKDLRSYSQDDNTEICVFGPFASGLCSKNSDADFTLNNGRECIEAPTYALQQLRYLNVASIPNARMPIVSFYDPVAGIPCDMSIGGRMAVVNSLLVKTYQRVDYRVSTVWFALRQLAKKHGILSGSTGYLSSYALTMMLTVFLQDITTSRFSPGCKRSKLVDRPTMRDWNDYVNFGELNTKSAGELLVGFLHYYGYILDYSTMEVNPREGVIRKRSVNPPARSQTDPAPKDWPICVLDPFITEKNVAGNCRANNLEGIRLCFQQAFHALYSGDIDTAFKR
ncbi:Zinc finger, CCHC domain-containing protein [Mortierella sp. GBA35]|nr:Zinc finger, CCHC domain-containing protein [Mortierella sp. GBA35]